MCEICDGMTFEESVEKLRSIVRRFGWAVQMVEPPRGRVGWAYTVGLSFSYAHPELVVLDDDVRRGGQLLNTLARRVRDGEVLDAGSELFADEHRVELVAVHPVHARGELLARWNDLESFDDLQREAPEALQVVVPDLVTASRQRDMRTKLDVPFARVPRC